MCYNFFVWIVIFLLYGRHYEVKLLSIYNRCLALRSAVLCFDRQLTYLKISLIHLITTLKHFYGISRVVFILGILQSCYQGMTPLGFLGCPGDDKNLYTGQSSNAFLPCVRSGNCSSYNPFAGFSLSFTLYLHSLVHTKDLRSLNDSFGSSFS